MLKHADIYIGLIGFARSPQNFTSPPCRGISERRVLLSEI